MSLDTSTGRLTVVNKGEWALTSSYNALDYVTSGSSSYLAIQAVPVGTALTNTAYWYAMPQYLEVRTHSSTDRLSEISKSNGIFNPLSVINQAFNEKGVAVRFEPAASKLYVDIYKDTNVLKMSTDIPDVMAYTESASDDRISRVDVKWKLKDGSGYVGTYSYLHYYLLEDGTVTDDSTASGRIEGDVKCIYVTADSIAEVQDKVLETFEGGELNHKIELTVPKNGCYKLTDYYPGEAVDVYVNGTKYSSYISQIKFSSNDNSMVITLGDLPVTLTDKLKEATG